MAARDDFFINFGSNADKLARDLKRDLGSAGEEVTKLEGLLAGLAAKSRGVEVFGKTLRDAGRVAEGKPIVQGGGGGKNGGVDFTGIQNAMDELRSDFGKIHTELLGVARSLALTSGQLRKGAGDDDTSAAGPLFSKHAAAGRGQSHWIDPVTKSYTTAGAPGAIYRPSTNDRAAQAAGGGGITITPAMLAQLTARAAAPAPVLAPASVSDVSTIQAATVQFDGADINGGFDRVVGALHEVRDLLRAGKGGVAGKGKTKKPKTTAEVEVEVEEVADDAETNLTALRRQLAQAQVTQRALRAVAKQGGDEMLKAFEGQLADLKQQETDVRQKIAEAERLQTGQTRGQRKAGNRAAAAAGKGPDLPDEEWDRRRDMRQRLDLALSKATLDSAVGRKDGQLTKDDLIGMAKQLSSMGFETRSGQNRTVEQLKTDILSSRQAMLGKYGADDPPELSISGRRIGTDKLSKSMQDLVAALNSNVSEQQRIKDARESFRMAGLVGAQPLDPTQRALADLPGSIKVPPGMVKGGQYDDDALTRFGAAPMGVEAARKTLDDVWRDRAMRMSERADFNLRDRDVNEEVSGKGEQADAARQQFYALRRASDELDDLADQYTVNRRALEKNAQFQERATARLEKAQKAGLPVGEDIAKRQAVLDATLEKAVESRLRDFQASGQRFGGTIEEQERTKGLWMEGQRNSLRMTGNYDAIPADRLKKAGLFPGDERKLAADPGKIADIQASIPRLIAAQEKVTAAMARTFGPELWARMQKVFESPEFQAGLEERNISRQVERNAIAARREEAELNPTAARVDVRDALGAGVINRRLAPGTKDTYIQDIAGASYNKFKDQFEYQSNEVADGNGGVRKRTKEEYEALDKVNEYWKRFNATHNRLAHAIETGADIDDVTKLARREESRATKFLNSLHNLFGMSVPLDRIVGTGNPVTAGLVGARDPKVAEADERRIRQTQALFADTTAGKGGSEEELLAIRLNNYALAVEDVTKATRAAKRGQDKLTRAEADETEALVAREAALDEAARAALGSARADRDAARAEMEALGARKTKYIDGRNIDKAIENSGRDETGAFRDPRLRDSLGYDTFTAPETDPETGRRITYAQGYGPSVADSNAEQNTRKAGELAAREADARSRITAILGEEADAVQAARARTRELERALKRSTDAREAEARNLKDLAVARARAKVESTESALREKERLGAGFGLTEGELQARGGIPVPFKNANMIQVAPQGERNLAGVSDDELAVARAKAKEARDALVAIQRIEPEDLVSELKAALDAAGGEVAEATGKQKSGRTSGPVDNTAEIKAISERRDAAIALGKQYTAANQELKAAKEAKDKAAIAAAQEKKRQIKADPAYLPANTRREMGRQLEDLRNGGDGSGGGPSGAGPSDPGGPNENSILRQILAAVKEVNQSIKSGLRITAGKVAVDKEGNVTVAPKARTPRAEDPANPRRAPGETREMALERTRIAHEAALLRGEERAEKLETKKASRGQRLAAIDTEREHATLRLRDAMAKLNETAKAELRTLDLLRKSGTPAQVAEQEARAIAAVERSIKQSNPTSTSTQRQQVGRDLTGLDRNQYDSARTSAKAMFGESFTKSVGEAGDDSRNLLAQRLFGNTGFWGRIAGSTGAFIVRNFAAGFVFGLTTALQDIVMQGIITESTFIRVSDALEQTGRSAGSLRTDLQGISSDYGVALNDVYMTAAGLTGVFDDVGDIGSATRVVAQLQAISMGALNAQEAMGVLASITGAYRDELRDSTDGLTQVADVLTVVQNVIGANVETTAEGVGALSGLAQQLKIPFEEMSVYVAQIAKLTNQTGAAAGENFSRILASMQSGRGRAALSEALPDSGIEQLIGSGEYGQAIQVLMGEWDGLSETQQRNLSVTIAGQRQARAFAALMSDTGKTLEATARAHNANGEAQARADRIAQTLNGRLQRLQANLQNLAQNLIRTGILDFFGLFLAVVNGALVGLNKFLSTLNDITDNNPFLNALKQWGAGLLGLIATLKLAQVAYRGFRASLSADTMVANGINGALGRGTDATGIPGTTSKKPLRQSLRDTGAGLAPALSGRADRLSALAADQALVRQIQSQGALVAAPALVSGYDPKDTAAVTAATKAQTNATKAQAAAARLATGPTKALGAGISGLAGIGLGATAAITGVAVAGALLAEEMGRQKRMQEQLLELNKRYNDATGEQLTNEEQKLKYVGPYTEISLQNAKDTTGFINESQFALAHVWSEFKKGASDAAGYAGKLGSIAGGGEGGGGQNDDMDVIRNKVGGWLDDLDALTGADKLGGDGFFKARDDWKGVVDDELQGQIDALRAATDAAINEVDGGTATNNELREGKARDLARVLNAVPGAYVDPETLVKQSQLTNTSKFSIKDVEKAGGTTGRKIDEMRADLIKEYDNGDGKMTEGKFAAGMAAIEEAAVSVNERIARQMALARGLLETDILSPEMIKEIDQLRPLLQGIQSTGGLDSKVFGEGLRSLIDDTGVSKGGEMATLLEQLARGGMTKVDALRTDAKAIKNQYDNIQAKYQAALTSTTGLEEGKVDEYQDQLIAKMAELAATTEAIIQAAISQATTLADAAVASGNFAAAGQALDLAIATIRAERGKFGPESPDVKAMNDLRLSQAYERKATDRSTGQNGPLQMQAAQSQNALVDAQLEAQQQRNVFLALRDQRDAANKVGETGPSVAALRAAKISWVTAEQSLSQLALQADISALALQAAGMWNGTALAQNSEAQALLQLNYAIEHSGIGSPEHTAALTAYTGAQHNTLSTLDQVAAATNDAALAAIPQGNGVAVAQQGVKNAQAALAAAEKYDHNSVEYQNALAQLYSAQQQVSSATSAVASAQVGVAIAIADAAGNTVKSAQLALVAARIQLSTALKNSGGAMSAEALQAKAGVISATAAVRDAKLQDELDTIDFNLEMGKITQSSAIKALQEILRTSDLTKQQRRQLLLQIKGMEEEMSSGPWNFGDIKLPKPYLMKRYMEEMRMNNTANASAAVQDSIGRDRLYGLGAPKGTEPTYQDQRMVEININGGNLAEIRRVVKEVVGTPTRTRTVAPRRGRG